MLHLLAPAKLNLYLRVIGKRPDGYHELETIFERIDLADELTFHEADDLRLTCSTPALSCGEDNLVLQAARLLQRVTDTSSGAAIHLTKRIPIAAGLGGGSSDAAATLLGLNQFWNTRCSAHELHELACRLGSDVPFFLADASFSLGRGRGELLEPVRDTKILWHVLVTPDAQLSTKEIFASADFTLTANAPSSTILLHALCNGSLGELATGLWNDLQPEAIRRCPVMAEAISHLQRAGCLGVMTSGSGPSVFGLCQDAAHARAVATQIRAFRSSTWFIHVVRTS